MSAPRPIPGIPFPGEEMSDPRYRTLTKVERNLYHRLSRLGHHQVAAMMLANTVHGPQSVSEDEKPVTGQQTRLGSLVEVVASTAIGFGIAMLTNAVVMPHFGHELSNSDNFWITVIFTVVSIVRGYIIRRIFTRIKGLHK